MQNFGQAHVVIHFGWKEKWIDMQVTDSWAAGNCLAEWSGTWEEQDCKIYDQVI